MPSPATIGFRAHSGWAAAVALTMADGTPAVIARRRIDMGLAQPYHAAALEPAEAQRIVANSLREASSMAKLGLRALIASLRDLGHEVTGCGILLASGRPLPPIEKILAAHPLLHTAEGEHFREALRAASRKCGLPVVEVKEREIFTRVAASLDMSESQVEQHLAAMGKAIGPPWRQDEKFAALAAWLSLRTQCRASEVR